MIPGEPVYVCRGGGKVHGRVLRENANGTQRWVVTPGGTVLKSGITWVRPSSPDDLVELRRYEQLSDRLYGGELDHVIGFTGDSL